MKAGDAILTIGLIGLGITAFWFISQYRAATAATAQTNTYSGINAAELDVAAQEIQLEQLTGQTTVNASGATSTAPVATAPTTPTTSTSTGQQ